jgi:O-antigen/teichoic acid export membrane protein
MVRVMVSRARRAWAFGFVRTARATGWFALARVVSQGGAFLSTLLVARRVGPSEFGQYALLLAAAAIVVNGLGTGVPVLTLRETASGRMSVQLLRRIVLTLLMATGAGTCITAVFGALTVGPRIGLVEGALAGGYFCMVCAVGLGSSLHSGRAGYGKAAVGEGLMGLFLPVTTWFALSVGGGVFGALIALVLAPVPAVAWLFLRLPPLPSTSGATLARPFRASISFVALGLASGGYARVDTVLLRFVSDPATVGIYAAAYRLMGPLQVLLSAFGTVFFSRVSATKARGVGWRDINSRGRILLIAVLAPMVLAGILLAPWAVGFLYGPSYSGAVLPARILLLSMLAVGWSWPSGHTLNAYDRQYTWVLILLVGVAVDAALVLVLGRRFGAVGAASAWLLVESGTVGMVSLAMRRLPQFGLSAAEVDHWNRDARPGN